MRAVSGSLGVLVCAATIVGCGSPNSDGTRGTPGSGGTTVVASGGTDATTGGTESGVGGNTTTSAGGSTGGSGTAGSNAGSGASGGTVCDVSTGGTADGTPGVWENVTPAEVDVQETANGAEIVLVDPVRPSDVYVGINVSGMWKSTDYGVNWAKANTGTNGEQIDTGGFPYAAIEPNPCRSPDVPPVIYVTQLFGAGCVWKSTDGAASWTNVWTDRVFAPDGTTNISADVGGDVHSIHFPDPNDTERVIVSLHGYGGNGDNNGIFETTNGGDSWVVHKAETFSFQPHNSLLFPLGPDLWMVTPGSVSSELDIFRTTDGAQTWTNLGEAPGRSIGRFFVRAGATVYSGADYGGGVRKSTDDGLTWTLIPDSGGQVSWVLATATNLYASSAYTSPPETLTAPLDDDTNWTVLTPAGEQPANGATSNVNGHNAGVTFDGTHYILIAAQHNAGILRYVEP
jgi:hypothetical protein